MFHYPPCLDQAEEQLLKAHTIYSSQRGPAHLDSLACQVRITSCCEWMDISSVVYGAGFATEATLTDNQK